MSKNIDHSKIAAHLVNGVPLSFKAYPDGSLVVIAPNGQKLLFDVEQVENVRVSHPKQTKQSLKQVIGQDKAQERALERGKTPPSGAKGTPVSKTKKTVSKK